MYVCICRSVNKHIYRYRYIKTLIGRYRQMIPKASKMLESENTETMPLKSGAKQAWLYNCHHLMLQVRKLNKMK